jgi:hypothetical protein
MDEAHPTMMLSAPAGADEADARPRLITIVRTTRSGSMLIEMLLGQLPGFVDVWAKCAICGSGDWRRKEACSTGAARFCSSERVGLEAFGGWDQLDATVLALKRAVERERYIPLRVQPRAWPLTSGG